MNYLAHLYLARQSDATLVGAMLGDFVKGRPDESLPTAVRAAIFHHRRIDSYTDSHLITRQSRERLDPRYRLLRGVLIDLFYDHFLARNWDDYCNEPLEQFSQRVYALLQADLAHHPERLRSMLPAMASNDWLASYRDTDNIARALRGISRRLSRPTVLAEGSAELLKNYDLLETDFRQFFPELEQFASELQLKSKS